MLSGKDPRCLHWIQCLFWSWILHITNNTYRMFRLDAISFNICWSKCYIQDIMKWISSSRRCVSYMPSRYLGSKINKSLALYQNDAGWVKRILWNDVSVASSVRKHGLNFLWNTTHLIRPVHYQTERLASHIWELNKVLPAKNHFSQDNGRTT